MKRILFYIALSVICAYLPFAILNLNMNAQKWPPAHIPACFISYIMCLVVSFINTSRKR